MCLYWQPPLASDPDALLECRAFVAATDVFSQGGSFRLLVHFPMIYVREPEIPGALCAFVTSTYVCTSVYSNARSVTRKGTKKIRLHSSVQTLSTAVPTVVPRRRSVDYRYLDTRYAAQTEEICDMIDDFVCFLHAR